MKRKFTFNQYPIDKIIPNSFNVNVMTTEEFGKLKESIKTTKGKYLQDNPIKILYDPEQDLYIIIDGEHRWSACKELGYATIPAEEEKDIDMGKIKELNVILSKDRGKINYFKFSKILNEEYWLDIKEAEENNWEYKKDRVKTTQQKLAERFGFTLDRIKHIRRIYQQLSRLIKSVSAHLFENEALIQLARCKNDLLREKLVDQSIKNKWNSKKIREYSTRLNNFNRYLEKNYDESTKEDILNDLAGNSLFDLSVDLKEKIIKMKENHNLKLINRYNSIWEKHNRTAIKIMESYDKEHGKAYSEGRYKKGYCGHPAYKLWEKDVLNFFEKFYKMNVICFRDGVKLKLGKNFIAHHKEYIWDFICYVFLGEEQLVLPCCNDCHEKGSSKDWNNKSKKKDIDGLFD